MEWSKSTISKSELEKKQREFMEQAVKMAQQAGYHSEEKEIPAVEHTPEPVIEEEKAEAVAEEEIIEAVEEITEAVEEITEKAEELTEEITAEPDFFGEPAPDVPEEEEPTFGVFDAEELSKAIESGEISGEGLKQAAEILEEMKNKTDMMKRLIAEQEAEKTSHNGDDYGLNSYIDRHNTNCQGCGHGKNHSS
ncbi:MAG: hypothetical protein IJ416_08920 [Ruminiclostridium sp.]|nr:hypothetical protein [Ruminiclostridium sp.]